MDKVILPEGLRGEGVRHLIVDNLNIEATVEPETRMLVYWAGDRPVAHHFVKPGVPGLHRETLPPSRLDRIADEKERRRRAELSASVIVCTRDRPDELRRCLASLPQQTYPPREVVVVDNGSQDDRTRNITLEAGAIYIREDRLGLDFARNAGARRASSDIVAYTDDDVVLHSGWLERLVAAFDAPEIGAVTGLVLPAELATEAQLHFERFWSFGHGYDRVDHLPEHFRAAGKQGYPAWKIGAGASMAFRRTVFARVGLFDERLDVGQAGCSGDSEYWYRLLANGLTCRYEPSSVAFHFHRKTLEGLSTQLFHYMRGHSAALLIQFERTGVWANLRRTFGSLPAWYMRRLVRRAISGQRPADRFLQQEFLGYVSGIAFYLRQPRPRDADVV